jgi:hypothetical protein
MKMLSFGGRETQASFWRYASVRRYTDQVVESSERLADELRNKVFRQQALVDQLADSKPLDLACSLLEEMTESLALVEQERARIVKALTE